MKQRLNAEVLGRVQGVGFRIFIKNKAERLNLNGVVLNTSKGTVKIVAEGETEALNKLLDYIRSGPLFSKVDRVESKYEKYVGNYKGFLIIREGRLLIDQLNSYKNFASNLFQTKNYG